MAAGESEGDPTVHFLGCVIVAVWVYILRLRSGSLYTGSTYDADHRYREHLGEGGS